MDNKEKIRLAINQIPINNCDGSANEDAIKAIRYLQEVSEALTLTDVVGQSEQLKCEHDMVLLGTKWVCKKKECNHSFH